ncbi:FK506-binding protein 4-like [Mesocricetus auratus]|uniref:FK506-binding protein 4-like n=1 Tax=Mesocricetus auratus TaxID=10036 RepID=A0ABM2XA39_MESAU|nr:FK506-binding protein 4-like [Mesocricetus auratus]
MSAVIEQEPRLPDQQQEGGGMGHVARQIVLLMLPINHANDDIDGTIAFLVSQAVMRAMVEEGCRQEEMWPGVEDMWPQVENDVWPDVEDMWPEDEDVWPDVEEDWYVWNNVQENEEAEDDQYYNNEEDEEEGDDDNYEYEEKEEEEEEDNKGDKQDEIPCEEIILHACKAQKVQSLNNHRFKRDKISPRSPDLAMEAQHWEVPPRRHRQPTSSLFFVVVAFTTTPQPTNPFKAQRFNKIFAVR